MLCATHPLFLLLIGAWAGAQWLAVPEKGAALMSRLAITVLLLQVARWATTLVASLGIGGIAVALALQNILGDLFSSLSIVLDKPFVVGDFIIVDDIAGTVQYVGLKTTRISSLGGEQVLCSNSDLRKIRIRNYTHMETRRIAFAIRVPVRRTGRLYVPGGL